MASYDVTIRATVTKTIRIDDAANEQIAIEEAHGIFSVCPDEGDEAEKYDEECVSCKDVTQ